MRGDRSSDSPQREMSKHREQATTGQIMAENFPELILLHLLTQWTKSPKQDEYKEAHTQRHHDESIQYQRPKEVQKSPERKVSSCKMK